MEPVKLNLPSEIPADKLVGIFNLQRGLIDHYIRIEGLPLYPLDMDLKLHQATMRDFISRGIEELSEAHECYRDLFEVLSNNHSARPELVVALNEELSDTLHFFTEAMIYAGLTPLDIESYANRVLSDRGMDLSELPPETYGSLDKLLLLSQFYFLEGPHKLMDLTLYGFNASTWIAADPQYEPIIKGYVVSSPLLRLNAELSWEITYHFNMARNCLKNRPWKQTDEHTNIEKFQECMLLGFRAFVNLLWSLGHTNESIYSIYYHKNIINQNRIADKR